MTTPQNTRSHGLPYVYATALEEYAVDLAEKLDEAGILTPGRLGDVVANMAQFPQKTARNLANGVSPQQVGVWCAWRLGALGTRKPDEICAGTSGIVTPAHPGEWGHAETPAETHARTWERSHAVILLQKLAARWDTPALALAARLIASGAHHGALKVSDSSRPAAQGEQGCPKCGCRFTVHTHQKVADTWFCPYCRQSEQEP